MEYTIREEISDLNSYIVDYIKNHPSWRDDFKELKITVKEDGDLAIFNYGFEADFFNPIVQEARGIIIDLNDLGIVCWPFRKFANSDEAYADTIDWNNCQVEDKIDGSIVKLYYYDNQWRWATNGCVNAFETAAGDTGKSFGQIIKSAVNYDEIEFNNLYEDYTYMFELVSPETQVVIHYPVTKLYHIGTRSNKDGTEHYTSIGIEHPMVYSIHTLQDCIEAAKSLNTGSNVKKEGCVVIDRNWHRVKIKSPEYLQLHHAWNNGNLSKANAIKMLFKDDVHEIDADGTIPRFSMLLRYYDFRLKELEYNIGRYIDYVRGLYEEFGHDRGAVAKVIKKHKMAGFGFTAIGNDMTAEKIINNTSVTTLCKFIPDYEMRDIYE